MADDLPQLTLDLIRAPALDFDSYYSSRNAEAVSALENWSVGTGIDAIWLAGAATTGKSHLLQAAIRAASKHGARAMYVPLAELVEGPAALLEDLHNVDFLALDDVDGCVGRPAWEHGLFRLYNDLHASKGRLLWSAGVPPAQCRFGLADLASRACASLVYQLHELADEDKAAALRAGAHRRGLELAPAAVEFILRRERRDMAALAELLDRLDRASFAHQRALTLPFVREVLALPAPFDSANVFQR